MTKAIFGVLIFTIVSITLKSQTDSSAIYTARISGGSSKDWFTHPVIIDNPGDFKFSTLIFNSKSKTGSFNRGTRGRDVAGSFKKFSNWKVRQLEKRYVLELSNHEKYFISFAGSKPKLLTLTAFSDNIPSGPSIEGVFFETPIKR